MGMGLDLASEVRAVGELDWTGLGWPFTKRGACGGRVVPENLGRAGRWSQRPSHIQAWKL